jgi:hypothetical protein
VEKVTLKCESAVRRDMFIAQSTSKPAKLRQERHEKMDRFHAAPTELESIYWALVYKQVAPIGAFNPIACRRFNGASESVCAKQPNGGPGPHSTSWRTFEGTFLDFLQV